jgi:hypothetical protein
MQFQNQIPWTQTHRAKRKAVALDDRYQATAAPGDAITRPLCLARPSSAGDVAMPPPGQLCLLPKFKRSVTTKRRASAKHTTKSKKRRTTYGPKEVHFHRTSGNKVVFKRSKKGRPVGSGLLLAGSGLSLAG